jgi:hypothetical protein
MVAHLDLEKPLQIPHATFVGRKDKVSDGIVMKGTSEHRGDGPDVADVRGAHLWKHVPMLGTPGAL